MVARFKEQEKEFIKFIKGACDNNKALYLPTNFGLNFNTLSYF